MRFGGGVRHDATDATYATVAAHHGCANRGAGNGSACDCDHASADDGCAVYNCRAADIGGPDGHRGSDLDRGARSSGSGCRLCRQCRL